MLAYCETCACDSEFELEDGVYACIQCFTQSQHVRQLEQCEDFSGGTTSFHLRAQKGAKEDGAGRVQKDLHHSMQRGPPWSTWELYTVLLRAQCEALVIAGAPKRLVEVVSSLWIRYLHNIGVAFHGDEETHASIGSLPSVRDQLYDQGLAPHCFYDMLQRRKRLAKKKRKAESEQKVKEEQGNDICFEKARTSGSHENEEQEVPKKDIEEEVKDENEEIEKLLNAPKLRMKRKQSFHPAGTSIHERKFFIHDLNALIYIGSRLCGFPVLPSHLYCWTLQGHLPPTVLRGIIPHEWKLKLADRIILRAYSHDHINQRDEQSYSVVNSRAITFCQIRLQNMLDALALELPEENISFVASRLMCDLRLPRTLHTVVHAFIKKYCIDWSSAASETGCFTEATAACYVVVGLQFLCGLCQEEILFSHFAEYYEKELYDKHEVDVKLFSFMRWSREVSCWPEDPLKTMVKRVVTSYQTRKEEMESYIGDQRYLCSAKFEKIEKLINLLEESMQLGEEGSDSEGSWPSFFPHRQQLAGCSKVGKENPGDKPTDRETRREELVSFLHDLDLFCQELRNINPACTIKPDDVIDAFNQFQGDFHREECQEDEKEAAQEVYGNGPCNEEVVVKSASRQFSPGRLPRHVHSPPLTLPLSTYNLIDPVDVPSSAGRASKCFPWRTRPYGKVSVERCGPALGWLVSHLAPLVLVKPHVLALDSYNLARRLLGPQDGKRTIFWGTPGKYNYWKIGKRERRQSSKDSKGKSMTTKSGVATPAKKGLSETKKAPSHQKKQ